MSGVWLDKISRFLSNEGVGIRPDDSSNLWLDEGDAGRVVMVAVSSAERVVGEGSEGGTWGCSGDAARTVHVEDSPNEGAVMPGLSWAIISIHD